MKKVLWATTFRDFKKNKNDCIQYAFINSLKAIDNVKIDLCVSLFGEKNVRSTVGEIYPNTFFFDSSKDLPPGVRYSQSSVLNNALELMKSGEYDALVWSTCDILLPPKAFDFIADLSTQECIVTSHPNAVMNEYGQYKVYGLESGGDFFCFLNLGIEKIESLIDINKRYPNYDYGIYEHFIISLGEILNLNVFNYFNHFKLLKFENDRKITDEPNAWLIGTWKKNQKTFLTMLHDYNISRFYSYNMTFCTTKLIRQGERVFFIYYIKLLFAVLFLVIRNSYRKYIKKNTQKFWELF